MDNFKEELQELLNRYGATLTSEGDDGVCVSSEKFDYFYFKQADEYGFDA